jgi:fructokinase
MTTPAVLVIGEALMDITDSTAASPRRPAAAPNIALGLARRGVAAALLTHLGTDERGRAIARHLEASGVGILPESFHDAPTSTARATLDATGAATYEFDIAWEVPGGLSLGETPGHPHGLARDLPRPRRRRRAAMLDAHPDAIVTFDPNIRPGLVGSRKAPAAVSSASPGARAS